MKYLSSLSFPCRRESSPSFAVNKRIGWIPAYAGMTMIAVSLSACAVLEPRPANDLYVLKAESPATQPSALPMNLRIDEPEVAAGLNTPRIAVLDTPNHLTYYSGAAWAQPLPQIVQGFLVDALQQSHGFASVSSDKEGVTADVILLTDIQDFEVENSAASPTVRLRLTAKLVDAVSHQVIAGFTVEKTAAAEANHMEAIVKAFNQALTDAAADMLQTLLGACASGCHPAQPQ